MAKTLVIVESPAKAKTINKYIGSDFIVKSSVGHIRDLPTSAAQAGAAAKEEGGAKVSAEVRKQRNLVRVMGIDPENGWKAHYVILPGKTKVLRELKQAATTADAIFLATDLDREGEAIAWHLRESIGGDPARYRRVTFSEITKSALQKAFSAPGAINMDRVNAQQARRFLDRVVGYMVSPLLWQKIARGLSAGRVQSVAVRLIVEREREIRAFMPEEYWELWADLLGKNPVRAQVVKHKGKNFKPVNKIQTDTAMAELEKAVYAITERKDAPTVSRPYPPFITTTLQQAASVRLGFGVKKTMLLAQRLYEAGHITYMRTDSFHLAPEAVGAARHFIEKEFGAAYLPEKPNYFASKAGAQEAHEAIRPTRTEAVPGAIPGLERDAERLYDLIWRQFVACQMKPAEFDTTAITIQAGDYELRARGRVMRFDGWMRVLPPAKKEDETEMPDLRVGDVLALKKLDPTQHFTKPPARYSEASLVRELEKRGIGRPSTYASIITTIQERGYVKLVSRRFYALKIGDIVTDRLVESFDDLMDYGFTAAMEEKLDAIATGEAEWKQTLDAFYAGFKQQLGAAGEKMRRNEPVPTDIPCAACGRPMVIRTAGTGVFLSCSGYELPPKERCKSTVNLIPGDEAAAVKPARESLEGEEEGNAEELLARRRCDQCGAAMDSYLMDARRKLHICGNSPDCDGWVIEEGVFKLKGYDGPTLVCDKCGAEMQLKTGRFGKYFGCSRYPECKNTRKLLRGGQAAPPKSDPVPMPELKCKKSDAYFLLRDGAAGLFLAAHTFPRSRETASPRVADLARHRAELDPKFHYLADAPQSDSDGNTFEIRWKRKEARQYLVGVNAAGEPSGWVAYYQDEQWQSKREKVSAPRRRR
ncbi:MAG TPA: type I DNA topoisomerase [bacterium]|nr:type I DNA topoisomerase [bacterium]